MADTQNYIELTYKGVWLLIDYSINVTVNGAPTTFFSIKKDFTTRIPITQPVMYIQASMAMRTAQTQVYTEPGKNYKLALEYSRFTGSLKFKQL